MDMDPTLEKAIKKRLKAYIDKVKEEAAAEEWERQRPRIEAFETLFFGLETCLCLARKARERKE